jgi:hypothetical protein
MGEAFTKLRENAQQYFSGADAAGVYALSTRHPGVVSGGQ